MIPGPDGNAGNSNASLNTTADELFGRPKQYTSVQATMHNVAEYQ